MIVIALGDRLHKQADAWRPKHKLRK